MWLRSPAFTAGDIIPRRYTCEGDNISPPLEWGEVPGGARSLALLCEDLDAPNGVWRHWIVYDIPRASTGLPEGAGGGDGAIHQADNDFHRQGYGGPCPPHEHGVHRYVFRLLALPADSLSPERHPSGHDVCEAAKANAIGEATLVGLFER